MAAQLGQAALHGVDRQPGPRGGLILTLPRGSEAAKRRPAVIVSNDPANRTAQRLGRGVLTVVPITSNVQRVYPFQVLLPAGTAGLKTDSKAQAEPVRPVAIGRIDGRPGALPEAIMVSIDQALRLHLAL